MIIIRAMTQSPESTQSTQSTQSTYLKYHGGRSRESSWMLEMEVNVLDCFLLVLDVEPGSILLAIYISPCDTLIRFPDKMAPMLENVSKMFFSPNQPAWYKHQNIYPNQTPTPNIKLQPKNNLFFLPTDTVKLKVSWNICRNHHLMVIISRFSKDYCWWLNAAMQRTSYRQRLRSRTAVVHFPNCNHHHHRLHHHHHYHHLSLGDEQYGPIINLSGQGQTDGRRKQSSEQISRWAAAE